MSTKTVGSIEIVNDGVQVTFNEGGKYTFPRNEVPANLQKGDVFTLQAGKPEPVTQKATQTKPRSTDSSR